MEEANVSVCSTCKHKTIPAFDEPCIDCGGKNDFKNYEPAEHYSQQAKSDAGKAQLTMVPRRIIWDIARVRMYGVNVKYPETGMDGWRTIGEERIRDAMFRHMLRYLDNPNGVDEESGLPHLWHVATNCAFLCELERDNDGISEQA